MVWYYDRIADCMRGSDAPYYCAPCFSSKSISISVRYGILSNSLSLSAGLQWIGLKRTFIKPNAMTKVRNVVGGETSQGCVMGAFKSSFAVQCLHVLLGARSHFKCILQTSNVIEDELTLKGGKSPPCLALTMMRNHQRTSYYRHALASRRQPSVWKKAHISSDDFGVCCLQHTADKSSGIEPESPRGAML